MNAKFEKWFDESNLICRGDALKSWQAALQSLEVTPELVSLHQSVWNDAMGKNYHPVTAALTAVFNAIKEQAK
jgi:hypothetical protein